MDAVRILETALDNPIALDALMELAGADIPVHPASAVKNGWSRIVQDAVRNGEVIVTNHSRPEVVVMDVANYADLMRRVRAKDPLKVLKADFECRFAALNNRTGNAKLRAAAAAGIPPPKRRKREAVRTAAR